MAKDNILVFNVIKNSLKFLNLLDSENHLSITNVAVVIVLFKLWSSPSASITEAGMLLVTLANYAHKRFVNQSNNIQETSEIDNIQKRIDDISSTVSVLSLQNGFKK